ncbi:Uncharacterized protein OS=Amoebophilus asiaticus (strain 5a2) GN=Aasi_0586 PE=4 SV=1: HTH_Tnp_4 [Gemmata massiliana]|uniref:Transposase Helix-turn-helix domain-containing protein n=1 Tax=Gemmata massiliana TaxID=1210884 RepID=A0A6P2DCA1_9BACT|nr:transposase family protein [Gemmata massiliana]VTR97985.1 Uncharacterized protein OS=Amoebophilus asiaticus (strain 5a2) GN=Aasi_0586 PE=4 SV=1: HTH_Tnp_4 [Gemmata massiliana]
MTNYEKLVRKPSFFRMFTGLSGAAFDQLLTDLEPVWLARKAKQSANRPRQRKPGAGREAKLRLADRLLLTLLYCRAHITQEFVGFLFGVGKGTVSRKVQELSPCMAGVFRIPEKKVRIDPDDPGAVFVDATEQPANRPKRGQRRRYSGTDNGYTHDCMAEARLNQRLLRNESIFFRHVRAVSGQTWGATWSRTSSSQSSCRT